jgi:hypothetical protein
LFHGCPLLVRPFVAGDAGVKQALDNFLHADNSRFDHEFFWAPYTLYGLG